MALAGEYLVKVIPHGLFIIDDDDRPRLGRRNHAMVLSAA